MILTFKATKRPPHGWTGKWRTLPRAGTTAHDYKRHGTAMLFAALNVLTGTVIGECRARHRHEEFLKFLRKIDREVPRPSRFI
jgi:hypothetical protein